MPRESLLEVSRASPFNPKFSFTSPYMQATTDSQAQGRRVLRAQGEYSTHPMVTLWSASTKMTIFISCTAGSVSKVIQ